VFHGAFTQIQELQLVLDMGKASDEQCIDAVKGLLSAWQESGSDEGAQTYLKDLKEKLNLMEKLKQRYMTNPVAQERVIR
jgi:hypothetical protein